MTVPWYLLRANIIDVVGTRIYSCLGWDDVLFPGTVVEWLLALLYLYLVVREGLSAVGPSLH